MCFNDFKTKYGIILYIHIFGITETHLNDVTDSSLFSVDGYTFIRKDRMTGIGGGVGCFIRSDIDWQRRSDLESPEIESIWIEVFQKNTSSILICITYRPPDTSKHLHPEFNDKLSDILEIGLAENKETIIIGDINCDFLKPTNNKSIKEILKRFGFKQIIKHATRITNLSNTLIDVILTTREDRISDHNVFPVSISDHDLTAGIRKMNCSKFMARKVTSRNYRKYNKNDFKSELRQQPWSNILNFNDADGAWSTFKSVFRAIVDKHAPLVERNVRGKDCPWLTDDIRSKMKDRDYHLRKARKTNLGEDWATYHKLRNNVTLKIKTSKANHKRETLRETITKPKQFWQRIKKCIGKSKAKSETKPSVIVNGTLSTDKQEICSGFCHFFTHIGKTLQKLLPFSETSIWKKHDHSTIKRELNPNDHRFTFQKVTTETIMKKIASLNSSKSPGYDDIPVQFLKDGAEEIAPTIACLINNCLASSVFPTAEKIAKITPIHKGESKQKIGNYRPISVLTCFSKLFELIVHEQVYSYLEANQFLNSSQFGFRKNRSTQHAVTILTDHIRRGIDNSILTGAAYIDLSKAFDTVDHGCIISKLKCYGIAGRELSWFESYLFNRKQFVVLDNTKSPMESVLCGVPQGSVLGPLLFVILMNDISSALSDCKILMYADDTVIYTSHANLDTVVAELNKDLDNLSNWFYMNNLIVNFKKGKTEYMIFGTARKLKNLDPVKVETKGITLNRTTTYKYLGVTLDQSLNYIDHLDAMYKKASARLSLLTKVRQYMSPFVAESVFKATVSPIMFYCSNLFVYKDHQRLQHLQDRANCIVYGRKSYPWRSVKNEMKLRCAVDVFKCLNGLNPENFREYFTRLHHCKITRGNNSLIILPKVRTESGRRSFKYQGAYIYNNLSKSVRDETSLVRFKHCCKDIF